MEKLITLLNEYDGDELEYTIIDGNVKRRVKNMVDPDKPYKWCSVWWYSKSFGFIKWLIDNDKIDLGKIKKLYRKSNEHSIHTYPIMYEYSDLECLLMLLSIQDNPIEFLISILK